jgi:hypothetical protein
MDYLFQDGGKPKKTKSKTASKTKSSTKTTTKTTKSKSSSKTGTKTTKSKTTSKKSSSKKGGNFLGAVGDLVAPTGWGPFATAAGLLALDRVDSALRRGKSTKSSAKKMSGGGGPVIKGPIYNSTPGRKNNPYKILENQLTPNEITNERLNNLEQKEVSSGNRLGNLQNSHSTIYLSQILRDENEKKRWRRRHNGFMDIFQDTKAAQARSLNKSIQGYYQKFTVDDYINLYNNYVLSHPNFNNSNNKTILLGRGLESLDFYFLSRITNIEILKKELKKLKRSVDFPRLSGNPDLTKLQYIGKYFKDPFEWVVLGADGKPVITQKVYLNLNKPNS